MNLIPDTAGVTPSYWCTWGLQNATLPHVANTSSWVGPARNLNEALLFQELGWAAHYLATVRRDLFLLLDLGWDVPICIDADKERWRLSPMLPDPARFPSCRGTPVERLRRLNALCSEAGWKGVGLWVAPQVPGDGKDANTPPDWEAAERHWRERARWSGEAGVGYWKADTGQHGRSVEYRRFMTRIAREEAPGLCVEHTAQSGPINDYPVPWNRRPAAKTGRFRGADRSFAIASEVLSFGDVLRTHDTVGPFEVVTTLDRVAQLFGVRERRPIGRALINGEGVAYLGAALGCTNGFMGHPLGVKPPHRPSLDQITRTVRWQRLAPAFGAGETDAVLDDHILVDRWRFPEGERDAWWVAGEDVVQGAPARVARGMPLPSVRCVGDPPFVVASRHPNGAFAVATLRRTLAERGTMLPRAEVCLTVDAGDQPIGVFGRFGSLTLLLAEPVGPRRLFAQDLAGDVAEEITAAVSSVGAQVTLPGALIDRIGTAAGTPGDASEPGLVLRLMR